MASRKGIQSLCSTTSLLPPSPSPQLLLKPSNGIKGHKSQAEAPLRVAEERDRIWAC